MAHLFEFSIENNSIVETDISNQINSENILSSFIEHSLNYQVNHDQEYSDNDIYLNNKNNSSTKKFQLFLIRNKRGRTKVNKKNSTKNHGKFDQDNIIRKIQVSYMNFLIDFINEIIKVIGLNKIKFIPLDYSYKTNVNKKHRKKLENETIEDVLKNKISAKYSTFDKNINIINCEKIKKENINILLNILNQKAFFFFDKIYYKNIKKFNLKEFGLNDLEIQLPDKIELFQDLLIRNKNCINFEKYKIMLNICAKKFFMPEKKKEIFQCNYKKDFI